MFVDRLRRSALEPVDSSSVAFFRIAFGVAMIVNTALYLPVLVREYYVDTSVHFPYGPLTFVRPLGGLGMHLVYGAMGVTGALIAAGKWYRPATAAFFLLTTFVFLLDSTFFQNHEYLVSVLALLMVFLPLDRRWSLDARRRPERWSPVVPRWVVWLLRFQIGVPYFYGGIAKLNADWLRGEPLRQWVGARTDVEPISTLLDHAWVVWFMAYGSLVLDLVVVWLLLHRRTRLAAFLIVTCFHVMNAWLFGLFIFPWLMIAATTVFFPPDWPQRWRTVVGIAPERRPPTPTPSSRLTPVPEQRRLWSVRRQLALTGLGLWVMAQLLVPLRHYAIAGNPSWTEQGHRFAWHMMLRSKHGTATFYVTKDGRTWSVDPSEHLGEKQAARLPGHPERLVHFARHLSDLYGGAEVRAETAVSLNGRRPQPIVAPDVDLAAVSTPWWGAPWILPLTEPLPEPAAP